MLGAPWGGERWGWPQAGQHGQGAGERGQHAQGEQVHLEQVQLRQVVLVPLHDGPVRHGRRLDGDGLAQRPARDHEPAHVDRQVAREPLQLARDLERQPHPLRVDRVQAGAGHEIDQLRRSRHPVWGPLGGDVRAHLVEALVGSHLLRQPVHLRRREAQRLAHVPERRLRPVGDHLAHHAGAVPPVPLVDVLHHLLAPLVLEVHVDVGRLPALGGDEAFEEQPHPHRVDGGDAQGEAHGGIGGAPTPLAEDPARAGEPHHVPDGEEVARVPELFDQGELPRELLGHVLGRIAAVPPARPFTDQRAEEPHPGEGRVGSRSRSRSRVRVRSGFRSGFKIRARPSEGGPQDRGSVHRRRPLHLVRARGRHLDPGGQRRRLDQHRRERVLAPDLFQPEQATAGDLGRGLETFGEVAPQPGHLLGPLERPLRVGKEPPPSLLDGGAQPDAGEHVLQDLALADVRVHVVHHRHRDAQPPAHRAGRQHARLLACHAVTRDRQGEPLAEGLPEPRRGVAVGARVERKEAPGARRHRLQRHPDLLLRAPRRGAPSACTGGTFMPAVGARDEPAQPGVALPVLREQDQAGAPGGQPVHLELHPHQQREPRLLRLGVRPHRAVETVHVGERQRREAQLRGAADQLLRVARALEEREARPASELGVARRAHQMLPRAPARSRVEIAEAINRRTRAGRAARRLRRGRSSSRPRSPGGRGSNRGRTAPTTTRRRAARDPGPPARPGPSRPRGSR